MILTKKCIYFKSETKPFELEKSGRKANTIRWLTISEYTALDRIVPEDISIENTTTGKKFCRRITDISCVLESLNMKLVLFSWKSTGGIDE